MAESGKSRFIRVIQLDDGAPLSHPIQADSEKAAIKAVLVELQSVVASCPELRSAVILMGEGSSEKGARWIGGWVWSKGGGFVWRELD